MQEKVREYIWGPQGIKSFIIEHGSLSSFKQNIDYNNHIHKLWGILID